MSRKAGGVRIIAGRLKGRRINVRTRQDLRPTSDRVREALFSIIGPAIEGARLLDCFAGTGANGFEGLSRGATSCVFIESDKRVVEDLRATADVLGVTGDVRVIQRPYDAGLRLAAHDRGFDFIFADPPYRFTEYGRVLELIREEGLLACEGRVIVEHEAGASIDLEGAGYERVRMATYGRTALSIYG